MYPLRIAVAFCLLSLVSASAGAKKLQDKVSGVWTKIHELNGTATSHYLVISKTADPNVRKSRKALTFE
jgi:hypothetical protein